MTIPARISGATAVGHGGKCRRSTAVVRLYRHSETGLSGWLRESQLSQSVRPFWKIEWHETPTCGHWAPMLTVGAMWERYRAYLRGKADKAAADPSHVKQFLAERREGAFWGLPLFPVIFIGWLFGLEGLAAILLMLPAAASCIVGGIYVLNVFREARRARANDS